MRRLFVLLLPLLLAVGMAACGAEKAAVPAPETQPETTPTTTQAAALETTQAAPATQETAEPMPDKILEPFFWEMPGSANPSIRQSISCTLEVADDATVTVKLYKSILFAKEDVESLQLNEKLALLIGDRTYVAEVADLRETTVEQATLLTVRLSCAGEELSLSPAMDGPLGAGKIIGYLPKDSSNTIMKACYESCTLAADSLVYQQKVGDGETEDLTGADLIRQLKEQPGAFHLENTHAWIQNGRIVSIYANIDPS